MRGQSCCCTEDAEYPCSCSSNTAQVLTGHTQHQDEQEVEERAQQRAHEVRGLTVAGHAHAAAALAVELVRVQLSRQHRPRSVTLLRTAYVQTLARQRGTCRCTSGTPLTQRQSQVGQKQLLKVEQNEYIIRAAHAENAQQATSLAHERHQLRAIWDGTMSITVTIPSSVDSATRLEVSIHADTRDVAMAARPDTDVQRSAAPTKLTVHMCAPHKQQSAKAQQRRRVRTKEHHELQDHVLRHTLARQHKCQGMLCKHPRLSTQACPASFQLLLRQRGHAPTTAGAGPASTGCCARASQ